MKCFIIDTLIGIFAIDELGNILNFILVSDSSQKVIEFYQSLNEGILLKDYKDFLKELANSGFNSFIFDNNELEKATSEENFHTSSNTSSLEFRNFRFNLLEKLKGIGLEKDVETIKIQFKEVQEKLIKKQISESGAQNDVMVIQIIETLDILKKSISLFSSRLREWYGLHFPELTDKISEENVILAEMISKLGDRNAFTNENLNNNFELGEARVQYLSKLASESMGSKIDIPIIKGFADQVISLDNYRIQLEAYLEVLLEKTAPNLNAIVGSLVGAKLIAKAGSLKKLAYMPASRIQLLGAEKALYRFLKTGERRPKHGLIFQWNQIRGSKPWNRGKISRLVAGKIGICAKVDYFNGEFIAEALSKDIEQKIIEIEKKYPNPPKKEYSPKRKVSSSKNYKKRKKR
jgi:nucleolar protein 56